MAGHANERPTQCAQIEGVAAPTSILLPMGSLQAQAHSDIYAIQKLVLNLEDSELLHEALQSLAQCRAALERTSVLQQARAAAPPGAMIPLKELMFEPVAWRETGLDDDTHLFSPGHWREDVSITALDQAPSYKLRLSEEAATRSLGRSPSCPCGCGFGRSADEDEAEACACQI
eukprot:6512968-Prymnesium_polylepis.1